MENGSYLSFEAQAISPDDDDEEEEMAALLASAVRHGIFCPSALPGDHTEHRRSLSTADLDLSIDGYDLPPTPTDSFNPFPDAIDLYGFETDDPSPSSSFLDENQEPDPTDSILEDQETLVSWEGFDYDPGDPIADDFDQQFDPGDPIADDFDQQFEDEEPMGAEDDEIPWDDEVMGADDEEVPWDEVDEGIIGLMFDAAGQVAIGDPLEGEEMDMDVDLGLLETGGFVRFFAVVGHVVPDYGLPQFEQLDTYELPPFGNPPAARSVVEGLPFIVLTAADVARNGNLCAVCKDEISLEETARQLPCLHHYHGDCILPWLAIRNTCPVCRFELPTEDPGFQRFE